MINVEYAINEDGLTPFAKTQFEVVDSLFHFLHSWNLGDGDYCKIKYRNGDDCKLEFTLTKRDPEIVLMTGNQGSIELCAKNNENSDELFEIEEGSVPQSFFWNIDALFREISRSITSQKLHEDVWVPLSELTAYFV